ncbi:PepSY domain-containing protein [Litorivivens sp.]|uniref:PepSY domain-containing protein n=1 Tax=Litorivivens sp. TaxID=2020868 RepID=UPI0035641BF2
MKRSLRLFLLRWHRRLGVAVALVVVMLVVTGIVLNHSAELRLDEKPVRQDVLLKRYGVELPAITSFEAGDQRLSLVGENRLFLNLKEIAYCELPLTAGMAYQGGLLALCRDQLLLLTREGEVVERLGSAYGLPSDIERVGIVTGQHEQLWFDTSEGLVLADLNSLAFSVGQAPPDTRWVTESPVPDALRVALNERYLGNDVHWERLLLDLHSGRLFGQWGVVVVDVSAVILLLLALSGAWVWLTKPGRWR